MVLVVADQAPVQYQGSVGLLDPPTLGLRHESLDLRVAGDDLDVDAQAGAVRDDLVLEALVDESFADCSAHLFGDLVQQDDPAALSWVFAARTTTAMTSPRTSTANPRLRPGTRLAGSWPLVSAGTPAATWTLCVSRTTRAGSSNRRARSRTWHRRSSWMTWSVPSSRHAAK